jgi:hypothetical protein
MLAVGRRCSTKYIPDIQRGGRSYAAMHVGIEHLRGLV